MADFYSELEWIQDRSLNGDPFYYFPGSMTLIESDENFGRLLAGFKTSGIQHTVEGPGEYPPGYVQDTLFNLDILRRRGLLSKFSFPGVPERVPVRRMILANTMRCNLACGYCYNRFASSASGVEDMTFEVFRNVTRFLEENGPDLPFYELSFIGGEPLLHPAILEKGAQWGDELKARGKDLFISATTNATLLDREMADFCKKRWIHLKLTLDGGRDEHNGNRIFPGGKGSYERIIGNLTHYFSTCRDNDRYAATTIDTLRSDPKERVVKLASLGFRIIDLVEVYLPGERHDLFNDEALQLRFSEKYRELFDYLFTGLQSRVYLHIIPIFDIVRSLHVRRPVFTRCRAGGDSLAAAPDGRVYACHHFFGDERFVLGSVNESAIPLSGLAPYRIPASERPECSMCWARLLCGGPCFHRSLAVAGNAFCCGKVECIRRRALILEAIRFYIRLRNDDKTSLDWFLARGAFRSHRG